MFEHVSVFLSFVYALGLTHLLASVTDLLNARDRVKWSVVHLGWMLAIALSLFINWFGLFRLHTLTEWPLRLVLLLFVQGLLQYFTCAMVAVRVEPEGVVDMPAAYERQRRLFLAGAIALGAIALVRAWAAGSVGIAVAGSALLLSTSVNAGGILTRLVAMFTKGRLLQLAAVALQLALLTTFLALSWKS